MKASFSQFLELTKPRILTLVLVTTVLGYYLGGQGISSISELIYLLIGTMLVCGGASTLNHYLESEFDSKMNRTKNRPIPSGAISPSTARLFGLILSLAGIALLYIKINILTAFLALLTIYLYTNVYTPLKRASWLNTTIGAIPGAIPPLGGWAAATGSLSFEAGMLFLILFLWQHPHFYAIAWMMKDDYALGGFKMLPVIEPDGKRMFRHIFWFTLVLVPVSLVPSFIGMSGSIYLVGAAISGVGLFIISQRFAKTQSKEDARRLLKATVVYLPILLILIVIDARF